MGFLTGSQCSNWGSLTPFPVFFFLAGGSHQEAIQDGCGCEVADDPVVVSKAGPMKASNGVEGKTWLTFANACKGVNRCQKHGELRRGEAYVKTVMSGLFFFWWVHEPPDQRDSPVWSHWEQ